MSYREWPDDARGARGRRHGDEWLDDETYARRPDPDGDYRSNRYDSRPDYPTGGSSRSGGRHSRQSPDDSTGWSTPDRYDDTGAWTRGDHTGEWQHTDDGWSPRSRPAPTSDIGTPWTPQTERPWARQNDPPGHGSSGRRPQDQPDAYEPRSFTGYDRAPTYRSSGSMPANPYWPDTTSTPEYDNPASTGSTGSVYRASGSASPPAYQERSAPGYGERRSDYRPEPDYQREPGYRADREPGYRADREPGYRAEPDYRPEPGYQREPDYRRESDYRSEADYRRGEPSSRHQMDDRTAEYRRESFRLDEPAPYQREPAQGRDEPAYGSAPTAPPYRDVPRQRPAAAPPPRRPAPPPTPARVPARAPAAAAADEEPDDEPAPGGYLASALYTVMWYAVPMVLWIVWSLTLNGEAAANCVDDTGVPCASDRTEALANLIDSLPRIGGTLLLSLVVAVVLRWVSESWRAATVGFAAAVVGGGAATVIFSVITGQPLG